MEESRLLLLKGLSFLLQYPQEDDFLIFDPAELPRGVIDAALSSFLSYRKERPLLRIQEEYTRTFDLRPATSLNLTFHHPKAECRGTLLIDLQNIYADAGYENLPGELPDYLPLILEFLSVCPEEHSLRIAREYAPAVNLLASRLEEAGSPYAGLVGAAGRLFADFAGRSGALV
ncbi:MAG TPA: nitrate reductase molybdenum cofactor assembly chaperone [Thermodesulfobacteriota bacterium]|nr:nitrate reductase molybdenum cofactor assembly chaperone [Thermodesulfobacteriota bacterium]